MKIKEITVGASYTYQPAQFHSAKGEAHFTVYIEEGDDLEQVQGEARAAVIESIVHTLAGVDEVHVQLFKKGKEPKDLIEPGDDEILLEEDDEW